VIFLAIFGCKRVNYDKMDGDRLRLPANRNCYRLSRISWALLKLLVYLPWRNGRLFWFWWLVRKYWNTSPVHVPWFPVLASLKSNWSVCYYLIFTYLNII